MCYKFYVPEDKEIKLIRAIMGYLQERHADVKTGNVYPGDIAAVLANNQKKTPAPFGMQWGYHLPNGKIVFNTRSETAAEKSIFADGIRQRRCVIPAAYYYETERSSKTEYQIRPGCSDALFLAGIYRFESEKPVFSVLTQSPTPEISFIHDRMPVIIPEPVIRDWLNPHYQAGEMIASIQNDMVYTRIENEKHTDSEQYPQTALWDI